MAQMGAERLSSPADWGQGLFRAWFRDSFARLINGVRELAPRAVVPAVILMAGLLRFLSLDSVPRAFADEILAAVDIHSVLSDGRHFTGAEAGLLAYMTPILDGRSVAALLLGTSVTDLRIVAVLFGVGSVGLMVKLGDELEDRRLGVLGALFLAIMPWHIYFSRVYLPASETVFLTVLALVLTLVALRKRSALYAVGAITTAVISIYLYPVSILTTPLLLLTVLMLRWQVVRQFGWKRTTVVMVLGVLVLLPYLVGRLASNDATVGAINEIILNRMIWSHGLSASEVIAGISWRWSSYLTPSFLFLEGDPNVRQSIQILGQVAWGIGALGVIGIVSAAIRRTRSDLLLLAWLLLYPVASSLTFLDASANSVRAVMGSVVWALLAALGVRTLLALRNRKLRSVLIAGSTLAVIVQLIVFSAVYFGSYSREQAYAFETGYERIHQVLKRRGVQDVPITLHAGYQRDAMLQYFSNYKLEAAQVIPACHVLPFDVRHYTVRPRVFIVREDRDYWLESHCIQGDLIRRDIRALRRTGAVVEVLKRYPNAPNSEFETAILFVRGSRNQERLAATDPYRTLTSTFLVGEGKKW